MGTCCSGGQRKVRIESCTLFHVAIHLFSDYVYFDSKAKAESKDLCTRALLFSFNYPLDKTEYKLR